MNTIIRAFKTVLTDIKSLFIFLTISIILFWMFLAIPVLTIPGNDFAFQLSILPRHEIILLVVLAISTALSLTFHIFVFRHKATVATSISFAGQGGIGSLSGIVASMFGTATCASCVASIFGFLGVGGVLFLVQYRTPITIGAIMLLLISLYFTSRKVLGVCEDCNTFGRRHNAHK